MRLGSGTMDKKELSGNSEKLRWLRRLEAVRWLICLTILSLFALDYWKTNHAA